MPAPLLQVKHLRTYYRTRSGLAKAVDDISFDLKSDRKSVV